MSKKILILLTLILVLGGLVLVLEHPFSDRFGVKEKPFYPNLEKDEVAAIEIEYFIQGTRFEKDNQGNWTVAAKKTELQENLEKEKKTDPLPAISTVKFPANPDKIGTILTTLTDLKKGTEVSDNPEKQGILQIAPTGLKVTLFDEKGKKLVRLFVGKQGPDLFSSFVRDEASNGIYLVEGNLQGLLNRQFEDWKKPNQATDLK